MREQRSLFGRFLVQSKIHRRITSLTLFGGLSNLRQAQVGGIKLVLKSSISASNLSVSYKSTLEL